VWIVTGESTSRVFLLAVDGSRNSLRALDHVLDIAGSHPDFKLTLFHVESNLKYLELVLGTGRPFGLPIEKLQLQKCILDNDNKRMNAFFDEAYKRVAAAGVDKRQVETKTRIWGYDVSMAVVEEARSG